MPAVNRRLSHPTGLLAGLALGLGPAAPASAHVSEMGLVLLLPTSIYIGAGVAAMALTVIALTLTPAASVARSWGGARLGPGVAPRGPGLLSWGSAIVLAGLIWAGLAGARDPLANPLPLYIWTVWWIGIVLLQGLAGDLWRALNPWIGPWRLLAPSAPPLTLPKAFGEWPGAALLLLFASFALADPAPADPGRLALIVALYWAVTLAGMLAFGAEPWLTRCEFATMLMRRFAALAPVSVSGETRVGPPGWRLAAAAAPGASGAVFSLLVLGAGSFDGLNETYRWLGFIGVNPLEFPGRSAVIGETVAGLLVVSALLIAVFAASIRLGLALAPGPAFGEAFRRLSVSVLPIGFAYHFAHYLVAALVNGQYALAATTDPMGSGADWLGLGQSYVTTGFLNAPAPVQVIFLVQAGAVVIGHVVAVMLSHALAGSLWGDGRRAGLGLIPLSAFMTAYTFFGLWLLAAPKGA